MDKTLLRPLFQKKYMELNKPHGVLCRCRHVIMQPVGYGQIKVNLVL